jgi:protein tyrosine phosphatase (PTP) superfamily phosphohydrolase (DUF442 family)
MVTAPKVESEARRGKPPSSRAKVFLGLALPSILLVVVAGRLLGSLSENFHLVIPGCVYRSGQLSSDSLEKRAARTGIRSVINLRGANPGRDWYEQECAVACRLGLSLYDLPVDSQCPTTLELSELLRVLEPCPKPVLIHCQSGIDRSGIVSAICILLLDESGSIERARLHLGWRYGHMPWRDNMGVQERFLEDYQDWLAGQEQSHSRGRFHDWLLQICKQEVMQSTSRDGR